MQVVDIKVEVYQILYRKQLINHYEKITAGYTDDYGSGLVLWDQFQLVLASYLVTFAKPIRFEVYMESAHTGLNSNSR